MSKILIITNHSYMLYRFRLELIQTLMKDHEVLLLLKHRLLGFRVAFLMQFLLKHR